MHLFATHPAIELVSLALAAFSLRYARARKLVPVRSRIKVLAFLLVSGFAIQSASAQSNVSASAKDLAGTPAYRVLSQSAEEVTVEIAPSFEFSDAKDSKTGAALKVVKANGCGYFSIAPGSPKAVAGLPGIPALTLSILTPDDEPVSVTISDERDSIVNATLAPVPSRAYHDHMAVPVYAIDRALYDVAPVVQPFVQTGGLFRAAHTQQVIVALAKIRAGGSLFSVLQHATLTIRFKSTGNSSQSLANSAASVSPEAREIFQQLFVNGDVSDFYTSAKSELLQRVKASTQGKSVDLVQSSGAQWVTVQTNDAGVYHISAQDLANAGISGSIDTASIQLFGTGGVMLTEAITPETGELRECAIAVHAASNGAFSDLYFYASGVVSWKYFSNLSYANKLDGLFHQVNNYTSSGHYLLKVGGSTGGALRIVTSPDTGVSNPQQSSTVFTATVSHNEKFFEHPNESREMVGNLIPLDGSQLSVQLQSPGYSTSACGYVRVGFDSFADSAHSVNVRVNGTLLGSIVGNPVEFNSDNQDISRTWDRGFSICSPLNPPFTTALTLTDPTEQNPSVWLAWLELFYQRSTDLNTGSVPFMVLDTTGAFLYRFSNARQGEVWDVSQDNAVTRLATDDGSGTVSVAVQGVPSGFRQLIAFSPSTLLTPQLGATPAPSLRATIGQSGAEDIIIAPQEFEIAADTLAAIRRAGGQATEPISAKVVLLEDIYREFGYGGNDLTAIRDFMAYTLRHTTANGTTQPLFLTLFGAGHADFQNRITQVPERIPAYEEPSQFDRHESVGPQDLLTDDGFFARLTNTSTPDIGVGRLSAETDDDAAAVVNKIEHYEQGSELGLWRGVATFVADDHYVENGQYDQLGDSHIGDTKAVIAIMKQYQNRLRANRVFEVNYPFVITSTGYSRPGAAQAILNAFNQGSVVLSFIGHGNPSVWTHESVLQVPSTINQMTNFDRLAFVSTATCDFSVDDDFSVQSGGVLLMLNPNGGAVSLLGTTREVTAQDPLVKTFYNTLFNVPCDSHVGTAHIGTCIMAGYQAGDLENGVRFYIQGDPALRLLVPRQYVVVDSINGRSVSGSGAPLKLPALSTVNISAHVSNLCDGSDLDASFNGTATVTLFDADATIERTTKYTDVSSITTDVFNMEGPILYRGTSSVSNGRLTASFIIPKDVEIDSNRATLNVLAYSNDERSALGANTSLQLLPSDSTASAGDTAGPTLAAWIGSRLFHPGDTVATSSVLIVDVHDLFGLNTSTASVGHSFSAWVDDSTQNMVDLSAGYVAKVNDFTSGTCTQNISLPIGPHVLHVRAFDALDNPKVLDVPFVGRGAYGLYAVTTFPSPMQDHTTFYFTQTGGEGTPVDITISIYDVIGRKVRVLSLTNVTSTVVQTVWDGSDGGGNRVANGGYVYTIVATDVATGVQATSLGRLIIRK